MEAVMSKQEKKPTADDLKALILAPTRELAIQVKNHLLKAAQFTDIKVSNNSYFILAYVKFTFTILFLTKIQFSKYYYI